MSSYLLQVAILLDTIQAFRGEVVTHIGSFFQTGLPLHPLSLVNGVCFWLCVYLLRLFKTSLRSFEQPWLVDTQKSPKTTYK